MPRRKEADLPSSLSVQIPYARNAYLRNKDLFVRGGGGGGRNVAIRGNAIFPVPLVLFARLVFA